MNMNLQFNNTSVGTVLFEDKDTFNIEFIDEQGETTPIWRSLLQYTLTDHDTYKVKINPKYEFDSLTDIFIPAKYKDKDIDTIDYGSFTNCNYLNNIFVDENNNTYASLEGLFCNKTKDKLLLYPRGRVTKEFKIPEEIKFVGGSAFENCRNLESVDFNQVEADYIQQGALGSCINLKSITCKHLPYTYSWMPPQSTDSIKFGTAGMGVLFFSTPQSDLTYTVKRAFTYNNITFQKEFYIPKSLKEIRLTGESLNDTALKGYPNITTIYISPNMKTIEQDAFKDCSDLSAVHIDDLKSWCSINFGNAIANPLSIAKNLYLNNELLTNLSIDQWEDDISIISDYAFYRSNISSVDLVVGTIGKSAFNQSAITQAIICASDINEYAFKGCNKLLSIDLELTTAGFIETEAFANCTNVTILNYNIAYLNEMWADNKRIFANLGAVGEGVHLNIGPNVHNLGKNLFNGETDSVPKITEVTFDDNSALTKINQYAFGNCSYLTEICLPESVQSIEPFSFYGCNNLISITVPFIGTSPGGNYYYDYLDNKVTSNAGDQRLGAIFGYEIQFLRYDSDDAPSTDYHLTHSEDDDPTMNKYYIYHLPNTLTTVKLTETDAVLPTDMLCHSDSIQHFYILGTIQQIMESAFDYKCPNIHITDLANWCSFDRLTSLSTPFDYNLYVGEDLITTLSIPYGVTHVGAYAFCQAKNISQINLCPTLQSIGFEGLSTRRIGGTYPVINTSTLIGIKTSGEVVGFANMSDRERYEAVTNTSITFLSLKYPNTTNIVMECRNETQDDRYCTIYLTISNNNPVDMQYTVQIDTADDMGEDYIWHDSETYTSVSLPANGSTQIRILQDTIMFEWAKIKLTDELGYLIYPITDIWKAGPLYESTSPEE